MDDYTIKFRYDHVHVQIAPGFKVDLDHRAELWKKLADVCEEYNSRRVLVEGFVPSGEHDTAEVIAAGKRTATVRKLWMAFHFENFVPNEQSELFEVIAASNGVRVKHFADREHALMWLRRNSPS
jgi:hypothetical protein